MCVCVCVQAYIYCSQAYNMYVSSAPPFSPSLLFTTHSQVFLSGDDRSDAVSETAEGGLSQRAWNKVKDGGSVFDGFLLAASQVFFLKGSPFK